MEAERPNRLLMESLLTLVCHDDKYGAIIVSMVASDLFEGDLRTLADKAYEYWKKYKRAPKKHTPDLVSDILSDSSDRRAQTFRNMIVALQETQPDLNPNFILDDIKTFLESQKIKMIVLETAEKIERDPKRYIAEIKETWRSALRNSESNEFTTGLKLTETDRVINYLESYGSEFVTGVKELNENYIVPTRGTTTLFIAPTNRGKTWWLIDLGKNAINLRKKVLHVSCELSEEEVAGRYYQSLFAASKRLMEEVTLTGLKLIKYRSGGAQLEDFQEVIVKPQFALLSMKSRKILKDKFERLGPRTTNLIIKRFPMRKLTMAKLDAYLDYLADIENFVPDMLILDYIGVTKTDPKNHRISLGHNYEELFGIAVERNLAVVTAHQASKEGEKSETIYATHGAEDWSLIGTSDVVITYSQTKHERSYGIARLLVDKARAEKAGMSILISQNYAMGQFCFESHPFDTTSNVVWERLIRGEQESDT